jgi:3-oxoadipate enol-lactonase/4-carboxymuconolactone decarboxylase
LSLFLLATAMEFPPPSGWQARIEAVAAGGMAAVADAVMARWVMDQAQPAAHGLRAMLLATPPQGYAAACAALRDARAEPLTHRLRCRATVVVGEFDQASPVPAAEAIRDAVSGSSMAILSGVSHIPTFEAAELISEALDHHLGAAGEAARPQGNSVQ